MRRIGVAVMVLLLTACDPSANRPAQPVRSSTTSTTTSATSTTAQATSPTTVPEPRDEVLVGRPDFIDSARGWAPISHRCDDRSCLFDVLATTDGGLTWRLRSRRPIDLGGPTGPGFQPTIHFATPTVGWLYDVPDQPDPPGRLFRTADGGRTWAALTTDHPTMALVAHGNVVWRLERHCPDRVAPCRYRLFRSTDTGAHWTLTTAQPETAGWVESFAAPSGQVAYVLSNRSDRIGQPEGAVAAPLLVRTVDRGRTWSRLRAPCTAGAGEEVATSAVPTDLWFVCSDIPASMSMAPKHLYRSSDGGARWSKRIDTIPAVGGGETIAGSPTRACRDGHGTIECTRDGGHTWFAPIPGGSDDASGGGVIAVEFLGRSAWLIGPEPSGGHYDVLWHSHDRAETWTPSVIAPGAARLWVIPSDAQRDTKVTIVGQNCQPPGRRTVDLAIGTPEASQPIGTARVDRNGRFTFRYRIPADLHAEPRIFSRPPTCSYQLFLRPP